MLKIRHKPLKAKLAIKKPCDQLPKSQTAIKPQPIKNIAITLHPTSHNHWLWLVIGCDLPSVGLLDFDWLD